MDKQTSMNYTLPTLPHGEGSMSYMPDGRIIYKKTICKKRISVYGHSVKEVMKKMKSKEKEQEKGIKQKERISTHSELLCEGLARWLEKYKKIDLKESSYDRMTDIIKNQINKYPIGHMEIGAITRDDVQELMSILIDKNYSYSTVKKTYETLNEFFKFIYANEPYKNIMLGTIKPTQKSVKVDVKKIDFFDDDDIQKMVEVAGQTKTNGQPIYKMGWGIIGIMYTGMRIGEALALKWKDVDFKEGNIYITKSSSLIKNRNKNSDKKYEIIYTTPKTKAGKRIIPMSKNAFDAFNKLKEQQKPISDEEFVLAGDTGNPINIRNIRRLLNTMQIRANTKVQNSGLHVLRHTFCSLLVRNHVDKVVIANILGQEGTDMIEKIYQHVTKEEKDKAIYSIDKFTELN